MKSDMTNNTDDDLPIPLPPVYIGWPRWVVHLIEYFGGAKGRVLPQPLDVYAPHSTGSAAEHPMVP